MSKRHPALWVPSLYFLQGLPYVVANNVSVALYASLGVANASMTFWTSNLGLVWSLKPLWAPLVDGVSTKRRWVVAMQLAMLPTMALVAMSLPLPGFFAWTLAGFTVLALLSATHDIAADGLYMLGLDDGQQAQWVGVRSTFWRLALVFAEGGLIALAGVLGRSMGDVAGWQITLAVAAAIFGIGALFHGWILPHAAEDVPQEQVAKRGQEALTAFLAKDRLWAFLLFILLFRFSENHLAKLVVPFLNAPVADGGLGWSLEQIGFAKGTVGVLCLVAGGLLGGLAIWRFGLKRCLWPMFIALNVPNLVYAWLAFVQPPEFEVGVALIGVEQFGYGYGFAAYLMTLLLLATGEHKTTHYAFATGLMALAVWVAGSWSGWMQEQLGYAQFFVWVSVLAIPAALGSMWVPIPDDFGKGKS